MLIRQSGVQPQYKLSSQKQQIGEKLLVENRHVNLVPKLYQMPQVLNATRSNFVFVERAAVSQVDVHPIRENNLLKSYFRSLYTQTMNEAYAHAHAEIVSALASGGSCLDCGSGAGHWFQRLNADAGLDRGDYYGIEWDAANSEQARSRGLQVVRGDLNQKLPFESNKFSCVFGLSVVEHILHPCSYIKECHRVLAPGGTLVLLTPNISTYFTAFLILLGRMPSSGPHPDSEFLVKSQEVYKVSSDEISTDAESETPNYRHLVVFSFRALRDYLNHEGFCNVRGRGFGLYPFPNFMQPLLEKIDPYHCHQMVFAARNAH